jgi:Transposase, Mutator family
LFLEPVRAGEVASPAAADLAEPFIDAEDIAEVAVAALTDDRHVGQLYEPTGPRLLTWAVAVAEIGRAAGRPGTSPTTPAAPPPLASGTPGEQSPSKGRDQPRQRSRLVGRRTGRGGRLPDRSVAGQVFPYVFVDATHCKARANRRVISQAVVATGVCGDGRLEVSALPSLVGRQSVAVPRQPGRGRCGLLLSWSGGPGG